MIPLVSIILPTYNEEKFISQCLNSILDQDYPYDRTEIIIIDGESNDNTLEIINKYLGSHRNIKVINNSDRIVPVAMNLGINESSGDFILRMDAHAEYPRNYISLLVKSAVIHKTDNIGGICVTDVKEKNVKTWAIKTVLSHRFGVGNSRFRTGSPKNEIVDTVPFGCYSRNVFEKFGNFDVRLVRNQDIEFNKRISKNGGKILLVPEIFCTYFARETFRDFAKNNFRNGFWNILTLYYTKSFYSLSLRHYIPLLLMLGIVLPVFLAFLKFEFIFLSFFVFFLYLISLVCISLFLGSLEMQKVLFLFLGFFSLHFSYGIGSLFGFFKIFKIKIQKGRNALQRN